MSTSKAMTAPRPWAGCFFLLSFVDASVVVTVDADATFALNHEQGAQALLELASGLECPASPNVALGTECQCGGKKCAKQKFCYPKKGKGAPSCNDDPRRDPSLLDWHGVTGKGQDGRDRGDITGRSFKFKKKDDKSAVRLFYSDNFRVHCHHHGSGSARWEIRIDNKPCPSGAMYQDLHVHSGENPHRINGFGGYCKGISKGEHTVTVQVNPTPGYSGRADAFTGWQGWGNGPSQFHLEAQEVPHDYNLYHVVSGNGNDGRDTGIVNQRTLSFKKQFEDSRLRLFYSDNLRVLGHGHVRACRWHIRVNDQACPSGTIMGDVYVHAPDNVHRMRSIMGYCEDVSAGEVKVDVYVSPTPGYSCDAYTGWLNSHFVLEAEEIPKEYSMVHYRGAHVQLGQDSGNLAAYEVKFNKKHKETRLRLFFSESLRAVNHHHDCACKWEIHIDGKNCPSVDIFGQVYVRKHNGNGKDTNPHRPRSFGGFCDDVSSGEHTAIVHLKAQGPSCDAYTGWKNDPPGKGGSGFLEVHEFFRPCSSSSKSDCKEPRCTWQKGLCADLVACPGHDKVAVGSPCMCGKSAAAEGKFCYADKTVHDAAKADEKSLAKQSVFVAGNVLVLSLMMAFHGL